MKNLLVRPRLPLLAAVGATLLAGCLEPTRQAAQPVPVTVVAPPVAGEPEIIGRPDPVAANVSAPVAEVARLHLSGLDETVVKAFVERSTNAASPSADEVIYLRDIGISPRVITAMIQQTAKMREQAAAAAVVPPPASSRPIITTINAPTPEPAPQPAAPAPAAATAPAPVAPVPQAAAAPAAQPAPANLPPQVNIFYQQLQPYGTWMQVADYGWCWQPSVVLSSPGWRPYADRGRWLHTDHGWYWQSDYAWGWAPFHYGRWVQHTRSGWLWVPDDVWGPAWVVWRSSGTHCGWAPLPPSAVFVAGRGLFHSGVRVGLNFDFGLPRHCFTFVPFNRFCDRNPYYYALGPTVVQNVFNQTTVINNIEVNNNVIVNNGVSADRVVTLTRTEIRKVSVREAAPQAAALSRLDRLEKSGNDLVIYRPSLNPNAPVKPVTLIHNNGDSRTVLVPAGALDGQKIKGRPVYDTTSTGVPVLTGYTTEPRPAPAAGTVIINNTIATSPAAPVVSTTPSLPGQSGPATESKPATATKVFGITPGGVAAKRSEERARPTVILPNPTENSLFRPLTPPQPVTSTPRPFTPAQPVTSVPRTPAAPQPVSAFQPATRVETTKPAASAAPAAVVTPAPRATAPAPFRPAAPVVVAPVPTRSAPPAPTYTPPPPRPAAPAPTVQVRPAAPVSAPPTVVVSPPPQPSFRPSAPAPSSPSRNEQEKRK